MPSGTAFHLPLCVCAEEDAADETDLRVEGLGLEQGEREREDALIRWPALPPTPFFAVRESSLRGRGGRVLITLFIFPPPEKARLAVKVERVSHRRF